ncbi:hypothetical protein [Nonomuraea sp. NPDC050786]|uniref:hypothetical protein n=1 Tax=Nonomuraea sp. NPDC050786 TaxID=3154840 RepID=UPI003409A872
MILKARATLPVVLTIRQTAEDFWENLLHAAPLHILDHITDDMESAPWTRQAAAAERDSRCGRA